MQMFELARICLTNRTLTSTRKSHCFLGFLGGVVHVLSLNQHLYLVLPVPTIVTSKHDCWCVNSTPVYRVYKPVRSVNIALLHPFAQHSTHR